MTYLGEEGQDGNSSVAAHDRHVHILGGKALGLSHEGVGAHDVQRCHAQHLARVVDSCLLEHLGCDWHCGVDRVRDDGDYCLRSHKPHTDQSPSCSVLHDCYHCTKAVEYVTTAGREKTKGLAAFTTDAI